MGIAWLSWRFRRTTQSGLVWTFTRVCRRSPSNLARLIVKSHLLVVTAIAAIAGMFA
jgi:hypothetical protein